MSQPASGPVYLTVEEFETYEIPDGMTAELVRGELVLTPGPGGRHGIIVVELAARLLAFVREHRLGTVLSGGFELVALPRTIRVPDIAFISAARASRADVPSGFVKITPDFVVEVLSPSDRRSRIQSKLDDYRKVRIPLVWLIDPKRRTITVITPAGAGVVREDGVLDGDAVLPGFSCPVAEIFEGLR